MSPCIELVTLRKFLDEGLSTAQRNRVTEHLESCTVCQQKTEDLLSHEPEIESTIQAHQKSSAESSLSRMSKTAQTSSDNKRVELPEEIGIFKVVQEIGRGASGIVYEAWQTNLNRRVAIKLISGPLFQHHSMKQRFLREAKSVASLNHPNIAQLYEINDSNEFGPYLVFEYVQGKPLNELIRDNASLEPKLAASICVDVAKAAEFAHEMQVIHRDLKPSNILIEQNSNAAKLVDFGLAVDPDSDERLTIDHFVAGTPAYMSPEQIQTPTNLDRRSDIYSLGVVLYELLTGKVPFHGSSQATLDQVLNVEPQRPRAIRSEIPIDLETICLKALSKDPDDRYPTMLEFQHDLERWLEGRPIHARPASSFTVAQRWAKRNPLTAAFAFAAASLLVLLTAGSLAGVVLLAGANNRTMRAKKESDLAATAALSQRDKLLSTIDSLVYEVNDDAETEYLDQNDLQIRLLNIALKGINETPDSIEISQRIGDIKFRLGCVYARDGNEELAASYFNEALEICSTIKSNHQLEVNFLRSLVLWEKTNLATANESLESVEALAEKAASCLNTNQQKQLSAEHKVRLTIHEGFARLNFGTELLAERDYSTAIRQFQLVLKNSATIEHNSPVPNEDISSQTYQALILRMGASEELAACYWLQDQRKRAAEFDSQANKLHYQIALFDDGDHLFSGNSDIDSEFDHLTALRRSARFYELALLSDNDAVAAFALDVPESEICYRQGLLALKLNQKEKASTFFKRCLKKESNLVANWTEADLLLVRSDAIRQLLQMKSDSRQELIEMYDGFVGELREAAKVDDYIQRQLNRLDYDYQISVQNWP